MRMKVMIMTNFVFFVFVLNFLICLFFLHFIRTFCCCTSTCVICLMNSY